MARRVGVTGGPVGGVCLISEVRWAGGEVGEPVKGQRCGRSVLRQWTHWKK